MQTVSCRILLVDDQPTMIEWARVILSQQTDFELFVCDRATTALDLARRVHPTVILQDLVMPGMSGFQLLEAYASAPELADVPVIVLSSIENAKDKARSFELGASDYLVKFPEPLELVARIRAHSHAYTTRRELRATKEELKLTLENASIGIALLTTEGKWLRINQALCRSLGYSCDELLARDLRSVTHPDDLELDREPLADLLAGRISSYQQTKRYLDRSGAVLWGRLSMAAARADDGQLRYLVAQIENITAQVSAEQIAAKQTAITSAVLGSMNDVVIMIDASGEIVVANEVAKRAFGPILARGAPPRWGPDEGVFHADQVTRCSAYEYPVTRALQGESVDEVVQWCKMADWPSGRWYSVTANPVRDQQGQLLGAVHVGRDITARRQLEEQIRRSALHDELTGILNRRGFSLLAEQLLTLTQRNSAPLFVMFVDLNGMKAINDRLGHELGDAALVTFAQMLRRVCREADVVGRLGGDEFAVAGEGSADGAATLRGRIVSAIEQENAGQRPYQLSASIGIAVHEAASRSSLSELLSAADRAMYEVKRASRTSLPR